MTIKLQEGKKFEAVKWNDNLSEMKRFCGDNCKITYETCSIDDFFLLTVYDALKDREVTVALHSYVIRLDENMYTVMDKQDFDLFFQEEKE